MSFVFTEKIGKNESSRFFSIFNRFFSSSRGKIYNLALSFKRAIVFEAISSTTCKYICFKYSNNLIFPKKKS